LILYGFTVRLLLKGLKETRLVTTGTYRYCQNPLYAFLILLVIPGLGLIMNSWLILTTSVIGYIVFRKFINSEYKEMTEVFGDEYLQYKERTPEFFPFI
jgi:protein-S-isoprenylcysteine O-methyltransferase Ste14